MANIDTLLAELDDAILRGDVDKVNRINIEINKALGGTVSESAHDYELLNNLKGKTIFGNLSKVINGEEVSNLFLVKLLSSLITHMAIESEKSNKDIKKFPIRTFMSAIDGLIFQDNYDRSEIIEFLDNRYGKFTRR